MCYKSFSSVPDISGLSNIWFENGLCFHFLDGIICSKKKKAFNFDTVWFMHSSLVTCAFFILCVIRLANLQSFTHIFSSRSFIDVLLYYIYDSFELVFMCGVRKESNFNFLHVGIQFSQNYLLKRLFFPPWIVLALLLKLTHSKLKGLLLDSHFLFHLFPDHTILITVAL